MAKRPKPTKDEEPSLFDLPDAIEDKPFVEQPRWEFFSLPFVDFIAQEEVVAFCYSMSVLEHVPGFYTQPVFAALFESLKYLSTSSKKGLRNQTFTVFGGDIIATNVFVLAISAKTGETVDIVASDMRRVPGFETVESAASDGLMPLFRYDNGYIIAYQEEESAGTSYLDDDDNYGTGLTVYRRYNLPAQEIARSRSVYGKLIKPAKK